MLMKMFIIKNKLRIHNLYFYVCMRFFICFLGIKIAIWDASLICSLSTHYIRSAYTLQL